MFQSRRSKGAIGLHGPQKVRLAVALIQREIVLGAYYVVLMFELELDVPCNRPASQKARYLTKQYCPFEQCSHEDESASEKLIRRYLVGPPRPRRLGFGLSGGLILYGPQQVQLDPLAQNPCLEHFACNSGFGIVTQIVARGHKKSSPLESIITRQAPARCCRVWLV